MHLSRGSSAGVAIGIGVLLLYVASSITWHRVKWRLTFADEAAAGRDPFAPLPVSSYPIPTSRARLDRIFYDFASAYARFSTPLKRWDSKGRPYYPKDQESALCYLRPLGEPSLFSRDSTDRNTYLRLTIIPFGDCISVYRITVPPEGTATLRAARLEDKVWEPEPKYRIEKSVEKVLSREDTASIHSIGSSPDFWKDLSELEEAFMLSILDGSAWYFEESSPEAYRFLYVHSPEYLSTEPNAMDFRDCKPYVEMAKRLFKTSGMPIEALFMEPPALATSDPFAGSTAPP